MLRRTLWLACIAVIGESQSQNADIVRGEYWIDQDLGNGGNIAFTVVNDPEVNNLQLPINLAGYDPGIHTIGIRTLDADGHWSPHELQFGCGDTRTRHAPERSC
ncbi:MAG: hypothetical protein IPI41_04315 [Flavobacteriales bacterium]|nr:hypothetical protein [Flavobacteriales bacterium]